MKDKSIFDRILPILRDPATGQPLRLEGGELVSSESRYPIIREVPRFVPSDNYVKSFSFEWNTHFDTQLDCYREDSFSEDEFTQKTGLTPEEIRERLVLDAGVGAGRYSEVVSRWGGDVVGVDLSYAVDAASRNLCERPNVWIAQADIGKLPFQDEAFDIIFSIGVLHHTPDTRHYFLRLVRLLRPGGTIAIWVYPDGGDYAVRRRWVPFVNKIPAGMFYAWCRWFVPWAQERLTNPWVGLVRRLFPFPTEGRGMENDILDTFDGYSPRYHWTHSAGEVKAWFEEAGLVDVYEPSSRWPTCMRGRKPEN